jgi:hypothetical protein
MVLNAEISGESSHGVELGASADECKVNVVAVTDVYNVLRSLEKVVDALLLSHDPNVADQIAATVLALWNGWLELHPRKVRTAADDEDTLRRHVPSSDRDVAIRLIRRD